MQISLRLSRSALERLDALAQSRDQTRSAALRGLILDAPMEAPERGEVTEQELMDLLAEKARGGNTSAIKMWLAYKARKDREGDPDTFEFEFDDEPQLRVVP